MDIFHFDIPISKFKDLLAATEEDGRTHDGNRIRKDVLFTL